jgi:uncharacterized protein YbjT (DUF2867 family)
MGNNMPDQLNNGSPAPPWKNESYYTHDLPTLPDSSIGTVLVTGASGYIGGRLVPELMVRGYRVRVMVRAASPQYEELWPGAEVVVADSLDIDSLKQAMEGIDTAYYLMHSLLMGPKNFTESEQSGASNFRIAAEEQGVKRIIYLGGLGDAQTKLSPHLRSRLIVGEELEKGTVPVTILRAAVIIGSGSSSYEIIKHMVRVLPVIFVPWWASTKCQPIAVRDVIKYLVGALENQELSGRSFDIGGTQTLTYRDMMRAVSELHGLKRLFLPAPFSYIGVYSYVTSLITPVPAPITRCLMEGLKNDVVCQNTDITELLPFQRMSFEESIVSAMNRDEQDRISTRWSNAYPPAHELAIKLHELKDTPLYTTQYSLKTAKEASALFRSICTVGGKDGWFSNNWMWYLRGLLDSLLLGVGNSRGRRSQSSLSVNDVIGLWRVEDIRPDERLLLRAEMKLPGRAWLELIIRDAGGMRELSIIPYFDTQTVSGKMYWYGFLPFHEIIFNDLIKQIEKRS